MKKEDIKIGLLVVNNGKSKQSLYHDITDPKLVLEVIRKSHYGNDWVCKVISGKIRNLNYNYVILKGDNITLNMNSFKPYINNLYKIY